MFRALENHLDAVAFLCHIVFRLDCHALGPCLF
jgi:hypothetical protein